MIVAGDLSSELDETRVGYDCGAKAMILTESKVHGHLSGIYFAVCFVFDASIASASSRLAIVVSRKESLLTKALRLPCMRSLHFYISIV
jgi:hypothetical protein